MITKRHLDRHTDRKTERKREKNTNHKSVNSKFDN